MKLINVDVTQFTNIVKCHKYGIILYGYGVIGKITAPFYLKENGLFGNFLYYVDGDKLKQGKSTLPSGEIIEVYPPEKLKNIDNNIIIVITVSRYKQVVEWMQQQNSLNNINVFILPEMIVKSKSVPITFDNYQNTMFCIPAVIHYCWFSGTPIPARFKTYIETWTKFCPDYKIIEWNESNYDVSANKFTEIAYKQKKWAFVSDYARFDILYKYGGIYLDTDVELVKNLDNLRHLSGFVGIEKWGVISSGSGCGFVPGHRIVKEIIELRDNLEFNNIVFEASGYYDTLPFLKKGFKPYDIVQKIDDTLVYSSEYFSPYNYMTKEINITDKTYSVHHFAESWVKDTSHKVETQLLI